MKLSDVQKHIISTLKNADTLSYTALRPNTTPNDLFNYHLKALVSKSLITKLPGGYRLSDEGRKYVADIHHTSDQAARLFKINVITIVSRVHAGRLEILTQKRLAQPSYGMIGVMGGTIVKGEPFNDGAARKLQQETGLTAKFYTVGIERRTLYKDNELFSDVLFPICYASSSSGTLLPASVFGENYWAPIEQAIVNDSRPFDSIQAIPKVLRAIQNDTISSLPFFCDETVQK